MIAIDIETTGLDPNVNQILEFAAVLENGKFFHEIIHWEDFVINSFCLEMHKDLLPLCRQGGISLNVLGPKFRQWLSDNGELTEYFEIVGANFAGFDAQFLKKVPEFPIWNFRILEIGSLYFDGTRPRSLKDICPTETPHRALPDAKATMQAYLQRKGIATPVGEDRISIKAPQHILTTVTYHPHPNGGGMVADSAFVSQYACVQKNAYVGEECSIGPFCVVEAGTIVPNGTVIGPNTRISNL